MPASLVLGLIVDHWTGSGAMGGYYDVTAARPDSPDLPLVIV